MILFRLQRMVSRWSLPLSKISRDLRVSWFIHHRYISSKRRTIYSITVSNAWLIGKQPLPSPRWYPEHQTYSYYSPHSYSTYAYGYEWPYSDSKSFTFDYASTNYISSMPWPVYHQRNAFLRYSDVNCSPILLNTCWMELEFPTKVADVCSPWETTLQIEVRMLLGTHDIKEDERALKMLEIYLSTSAVDILPLNRAAAQKYWPAFVLTEHSIFFGLNSSWAN